MSILDQPHCHDDAAAFAMLESILWPDGPVCPKCGCIGRSRRLGGTSSRMGVWKCYDCRKQFTVKVGTVYEQSNVPLHKWFQATHRLCASKKGMSSNQLHRILGVTLKTAWFMTVRIREAMREGKIPAMLSGEGKFVEADESFTGGKPKNRALKAPPPKEAVMALIERGGKVHSFHAPEVTAATLEPIIVDAIAKDSHQNRRARCLLEDRRGIRQSQDSHSLHRRIRPWRCAPQYDRGLFFDPQTRHLWRVSPCEPTASETVSGRVRFSLQ